MNDYKVVVAIDIYAENPEEAVNKFIEIIKDTGGETQIYDVMDRKRGDIVRVDKEYETVTAIDYDDAMGM